MSKEKKIILMVKGPFVACHSVIPPADYFEDCVYDLCLFFENDLEHTEAMCELYNSYAQECADVGVTGKILITKKYRLPLDFLSFA